MSGKRQRNHVKTTLRAMRERGTCTRTEVGISSVEAIRLEDEGLIRRRGTVQTGQRGRPAIKWGLTDKAQKRVKRAMAA